MWLVSLLQIQSCVCACACTCMCIQVDACVYLCTYVYIYAYVNLCTYVYVCVEYRGQHLVSSRNIYFLRSHLPSFWGQGFSLGPRTDQTGQTSQSMNPCHLTACVARVGGHTCTSAHFLFLCVCGGGRILRIKLGSSCLQDKYFIESYPQPARSILNALKFSMMHSHNDGDGDSNPWKWLSPSLMDLNFPLVKLGAELSHCFSAFSCMTPLTLSSGKSLSQK